MSPKYDFQWVINLLLARDTEVRYCTLFVNTLFVNMGPLTFLVHVTYCLTTHPKDEAIMVLSVLLKDTNAMTDQAGIRTHDRNTV